MAKWWEVALGAAAGAADVALDREPSLQQTPGGPPPPGSFTTRQPLNLGEFIQLPEVPTELRPSPGLIALVVIAGLGLFFLTRRPATRSS